MTVSNEYVKNSKFAAQLRHGTIFEEDWPYSGDAIYLYTPWHIHWRDYRKGNRGAQISLTN